MAEPDGAAPPRPPVVVRIRGRWALLMATFVIGGIVVIGWGAVATLTNERIVPAGRMILVALLVSIVLAFVIAATFPFLRWLRRRPEYVIDDLGITWGPDALRDPFVAWADIEAVSLRPFTSRYVSDKIFIVHSRLDPRQATAGLRWHRRWGVLAAAWLGRDPYQMSTVMVTPGYEVMAAEIEVRMGRPIEPA
jgi:hypothetical protein